MKKSLTALALVLALAGTLTACGTDRNTGGTGTGSNSTNASGASGTNPAGSGINGAGTNGSGASAGQVSRRYDAGTVYNGRTYWNDGRYAAGSNGQVYGTDNYAAGRDLTRDARDMVRDAGDAIGDIGRGIGNAARDITGTNPGTPSWEPDSSAARY